MTLIFNILFSFNQMIQFLIYATIYYFGALFVKNYDLSYTNLMVA